MADTWRRREVNKTWTSDTGRGSSSAGQLTVNSGHNRRDVNAVSKLVSRKLDVFLNDVKRELAFDPTGGRRAMSAGPCTYTGTAWNNQLHGPDHLERARSATTPRESSKSPRRHSANRQANRLNQYASCLLDAEADRNITAIHRLRPTFDYKDSSTSPILVQNFRLHFGTALTVDKYLEFYENRGLSGGSARRNMKANDLNDKSKRVNNDRADLRFAASEQRMLENYCRRMNMDTQTSPRYLESSWDVAASVRHQMRTFTVNEIRRLRQRCAESIGGSSTPVRVCIEDDEVNDHHSYYDGDHDLGNDLLSAEDDDNYDMSLKHRYLQELANHRLRKKESSTNVDESAVCDVSELDPDCDSDSVDYGY